MLSEKDKSIVSEMCRTGMSLDVLKKSFPQFSSEDVEAVFVEQSGNQGYEDIDITISLNCS